jgi:hypothetical protein
MERVVRATGAGQALAMRAGVRGGHDRNRRYTRKCAGGLDHEDPPESLPFFRQGSCQYCGVFRDCRKAVFPADLKLGSYDLRVIATGQADNPGYDLP